MKQGIAFILLISFSLMTFSKAFTFVAFYANQDAIIERFCINKNKPQLLCNGKCFLSKQIKEQEKKDAEHFITQLSKIEIAYRPYETCAGHKPGFSLIKRVYTIKADPPLAAGFMNDLNRPPAAWSYLQFIAWEPFDRFPIISSKIKRTNPLLAKRITATVSDEPRRHHLIKKWKNLHFRP